MRTLLLVAHVLAAILFIGPSTVATSSFVRYAATETLPVARVLHGITRAYGTASLAVPVVGLVLAGRSGYLSAGWVALSLVLFAAALSLLALVVVPAQRQALAAVEASREVPAALRSRLHGASGAYAVAWVIVLVLMVAKPF